MVCALLLGALAAGLYVLTTPPSFTATAEAIVVTKGDGENASELVQSSDYSQSQVRSFSALVTRPIVLDPVIDELHLETTASSLAKQITVTSPLNTALLSIEVTRSSPQAAADIANATAASLADAVAEFVPTTARGEPTVALHPVQTATPPALPSAPNPTLALAFGLLLGAVAGVVAVAVREALDTKVRSTEDVEQHVRAPRLGVIALESEAAAKSLVGGSEDMSARAEAFRHIRTNVRFLNAAEGLSLVAITSAVPGEGKSMTAVNLAITLASAGERVCLVEADLRKPSLGSYLALESAAGLTTVLLGKAGIEDVVQPWGEMHLDVLLSGQLPPNPSELLGSTSFQSLLMELDSRYDTVIVDGPPLVPVTDSALIAKTCGGAILVVGAGKVSRTDLHYAVQALEQVSVPVLGTVVNRARRAEIGAGRFAYASANDRGGRPADGHVPGGSRVLDTPAPKRPPDAARRSPGGRDRSRTSAGISSVRAGHPGRAAEEERAGDETTTVQEIERV